MAQGVHVKWLRVIRGKLRSLGLRRYGIGVVAKTNQGLFVIDPKDFGVGRALLDRGAYEAEIIDYFLSKIDSNSNVVFVGAHIGAILIPIARKASRVIAFEPNPPTFELLELNVGLNNLTNVELHNYALSNTRELLRMRHNAINTGGSYVTKNTDDNDISVQAIPLDDVVGDIQIDLMIVDAEGFEVQVFLGGQKTLGNTKILYSEYCRAHLRRQGATPEEFIEALDGHFKTFHFETAESERRPHDELSETLRALPMRESSLVNLTLAK